MLICADKLDDEQLAALDLLSAQCKITDLNTIPIYRHLLIQPRVLPSVLCYEEKELVGFLSPFFFYEDATEIVLMVSPSFRNRGLAKQMLKRILTLIEVMEVSTLIFSSAKKLDEDWQISQGFKYHNSEYEMRRQSQSMINFSPHLLSIRPAGTDDINSIIAIDKLAFSNQHDDLYTRISNVLSNPHYSVFIATLNGLIIGKVHVKWDTQGARFSDIAILPEHRGHGYGYLMLAQCINLAIEASKPNLSLDVETNNANALKLYTKLGFSIQNACDYWSIPLKDLQEKIK